MNFVTALAYHFCLALPAVFTQPADHLLAKPCRCCDGSGCNLYLRILARYRCIHSPLISSAGIIAVHLSVCSTAISDHVLQRAILMTYAIINSVSHRFLGRYLEWQKVWHPDRHICSPRPKEVSHLLETFITHQQKSNQPRADTLLLRGYDIHKFFRLFPLPLLHNSQNLPVLSAKCLNPPFVCVRRV